MKTDHYRDIWPAIAGKQIEVTLKKNTIIGKAVASRKSGLNMWLHVSIDGLADPKEIMVRSISSIELITHQ